MAQMIMADGKRTEVRPKKESGFTIEELEGYVDGPLEITEINESFYMVSLRKGKEIGAERNAAASVGYEIHLAHLKADGKGPKQPAPEFYGTCVFCTAAELGNDPAYSGMVEA